MCKLSTARRFNELYSELDPYEYGEALVEAGSKKQLALSTKDLLSDRDRRDNAIEDLVSYFETCEPGDETFVRIALMINELTKMEE